MAMLNVLASHFGLESTGYGRTLRSKDEIFRIVAITSNRSKCPINAERINDGRGFNCPTSNVAMRLSSVHALRKYTLCSFKSPNMQIRAPYPVQRDKIVNTDGFSKRLFGVLHLPDLLFAFNVIRNG